MIFYRRLAILLSICTFIITLTVIRSGNGLKQSRIWRDVPQAVKLGEWVDHEKDDNHLQKPSGKVDNGPKSMSNAGDADNAEITHQSSSPQDPPAVLQPSHSQPTSNGSKYTKAVILGRLSTENVDWLNTSSSSSSSSFPSEVQQYIYIVDSDPSTKHLPLHTPANKGHEAMIYLSYIIDHYQTLPDINIFLHAHKIAWHTNELLNHDATEVIKRLSPERVIREGYMNIRCFWAPGCPEWIRPKLGYYDPEKPEQGAMAGAWAELFPDASLPDVIASPCCAQFAVSRDAIRKLPLEKYVHFRDWLIRTRLPDGTSGRVFEYLWGYIFTGQSQNCPDQRVCYCDGFGICFDDSEEFERFFEMKFRWEGLHDELKEWRERVGEFGRVRVEIERGGWWWWLLGAGNGNGNGNGGEVIEEKNLVIPKVDGDTRILREIDGLFKRMQEMRHLAIVRGLDPSVRARVAGRPWKEGDGF